MGLGMLDMRSVLLTAVLPVLLAGGGLVALQRLLSDLRGFRAAGWGLVLCALGLLGIGLRGELPVPLTVVAANLAIASAFALIYEAGADLRAAAPRWRPAVWGAVLVLGGATVYYTYLEPQAGMRVFWVASLATALWLAVAQVLLGAGERPRQPAHRVLAGLAGLFAAAFGWRMVDALRVLSADGDLLQAPTGQVAWVLLLLVLAWLLAATLLWVAYVQARADIGARAEELQSLARRFAFANHFADIGVYERDLQTGGLFWNPQMCTVFGLPVEARLPEEEWPVFSTLAEDAPLVVNAIERSVNERTVEIAEFRVRWPDGSVHWLRATTALAEVADQAAPERLIGVLVNITRPRSIREQLARRVEELADAKAELERTQLSMLQREKMAALGVLSAGVAHEINNPLAFIGANLKTLMEYLDGLGQMVEAQQALVSALEAGDAGAAAPARERVEALRASVDPDFVLSDAPQLSAETRGGWERIRKIVADLRTFARPGEAGWEQADLHEGLESTLNIAWHEIKHKARIEREYDPQLPRVRCIPSQINQVFLNLLVNAAQAIQGTGTITLCSGHDDEAVWVEVGDDGAGITEEARQRIFEPFFTTKPVGEGTGLGLALAFGIVERHGGRIELDSAPGQGARFRVWLPRRSTAAEAIGRRGGGE